MIATFAKSNFICFLNESSYSYTEALNETIVNEVVIVIHMNS